MPQHKVIPPQMQESMISSFWTMLCELESQAHGANDRFLKFQVEGFYRQWNAVTGDTKSPKWAEEN